MRNIDMNHVSSFFAGLGIGIAASILLSPESGEKTRSRIRDAASRAGNVLKEQAESLGDAAGDVLEKGKRAWQKEGSPAMSDLKDKAKDKISDAADAARKTADQVADKSRDLAHNAGKKMEEGGKRLQDA